MKKLRALGLCAVMLLLCGCSIKTEYNMEIKNDKSMKFSIIAAFDEQLIDGMLSMQNNSGGQKEYTDEERWAMIEESQDSEDESKPEDYGFTEERYDENGYKGYKYTKKISNIDDISGDAANFKLEDYKNISDKIVFVKDGNKYKASFVMSSEEQESSTQGYDIGIDMLFTVTLPNKPISHNATEVSEDGKTLTWNLLESGSQNIEFEFTFKNNTILYIIIGAVAVVVVLSIIGIIVSKGKKNKGGNVNVPVNTTEPVAQEPQNTQPQSFFQQQPVETMQQPWAQPEVQPNSMFEPIVENNQVQPQVQPQMQQPEQQSVPTEPTIEQPQVQQMPSVADLMGMTNNPENKN